MRPIQHDPTHCCVNGCIPRGPNEHCEPPGRYPTPRPVPEPPGWYPTPFPVPGPGGPSTSCPPGSVWVQGNNSLGLPAGCYANQLSPKFPPLASARPASSTCSPFIPAYPPHHGGVDACHDGRGNLTGFFTHQLRPGVVDPWG
jgi:hypothetical protein